MATLVFVGQATDSPTSDQTIGATDRMSFWSSGFEVAITVDEYNDETHVENTSEVEICTVTHMSNTKYLGSALIDINGAGSEDIANLLEAECPLKVHFNEADSAISDAILWAFDNTTDTADPTGINIYGAEQGDAAWTDIRAASGSDLTLGDKSSATDHYWYVALSVSPTSIGEKKACGIKVQLTYQ